MSPHAFALLSLLRVGLICLTVLLCFAQMRACAEPKPVPIYCVGE